jgi:hypothetical protein
MRAFDEPNLHGGWVCPICGTSAVKPVVLIGIEGTQEGHNIQAEQFHLDCIELTFFKDKHIIASSFRRGDEDKQNNETY